MHLYRPLSEVEKVCKATERLCRNLACQEGRKNEGKERETVEWQEENKKL